MTNKSYLLTGQLREALVEVMNMIRTNQPSHLKWVKVARRYPGEKVCGRIEWQQAEPRPEDHRPQAKKRADELKFWEFPF